MGAARRDHSDYQGIYMAKKLWGGRFKQPTDPVFEEFSRSVQYDHKLAEYDIIGSIIHVHVLMKAKYLTASEGKRLVGGLRSILKGFKAGTCRPDLSQEDIHTQIQNMLQKSVGDVALKLHTARSRNDQVVFAVKLYCKAQIARTVEGITFLTDALAYAARKYEDMVIPGFTHMQHAQPVYLKDYFAAYSAMFERDAVRLKNIDTSMRVSLGAGALAGTPIPAGDYSVDPGSIPEAKAVATFTVLHSTCNALDVVSDRDFVIEILSALSVMAMHASRLAEDLILWASKEFGFVDLDDAFCTGSSLMPQKKNADSLELIRGMTGRFYGNLVGVMTMMKGLPLSYNRDMQLDKEPLFASFEAAGAVSNILAGLIKTLTVNKEAVYAHLEDESLYATDLVYYLVEKGLAFKLAHTAVGELVRYSIDEGIAIKDMDERALRGFSPLFKKQEILKLFDPVVSVTSKRSIKR